MEPGCSFAIRGLWGLHDTLTLSAQKKESSAGSPRLHICPRVRPQAEALFVFQGFLRMDSQTGQYGQYCSSDKPKQAQKNQSVNI